MRVSVFLIPGCAVLCLALQAAQKPDPPASFIAHPVATDIFGGRQLAAADVNNDGKQDLIALGRQMSQLVWLENPYWQRHAIMHGTGGMTNLAATDLDGDGVPEIALAYGFGADANRAGTIALLEHLGDPRGIWTLRNIHEIAALRRLLWVDVDQSGQKALVDAPLSGADHAGFEESDRTATPVVFYRPGAWKQEILTLESRDRARELLVSESGDIVIGSMNGRRFFATSAAGNLVIYRQDPQGAWQSTLVDGGLPNGRALLTIDIDNNGNHEIVASAPGAPKAVYLYRATDPDGQKWQRLILDETMAAGHCVAVEINADNKRDISCIDDTSPFSVHWYQNVSD